MKTEELSRLKSEIQPRWDDLREQRVLGAGGEIKLRGDGAIEQRMRLDAEGVLFRGRRVDMKRCEYKFPKKSIRKK